jgi:Raf kinase inhibitor-like YbhB/YbcL family protein
MKTAQALVAALVSSLLLGATGMAHAAGMQVTSSSFKENGKMPKIHASDAAGCNGKNVSPQVSWSHLPAGTQSVAVILADPDGGKGLGVVHWVAYNIDAARGKLKQGEGLEDSAGITVGKNVGGTLRYRGMCPPAGDFPHHYVLSVIATDVAPGSLPTGLDRDALLAALKGHALQGQSIVGRYAQ